MKGAFVSLRRLRWRLTLSYALFTTVIFCILNVGFLLGLLAYQQRDMARFIAEDLAYTAAPRFQALLVHAPPDAEALRETLEDELYPGHEEEMGTLDRVLAGTLPKKGVSLFVTDLEGRVLGSARGEDGIPVVERPGASVGEAGLEPLVKAVFEGEDDPRRLSTHEDREDRMLAAAPIRGEDGRVVGAIARTYPEPGLAELLLPILFQTVSTAIMAAIAGTAFGFLTARGLTRRLGRLALAAQSWSRGDFSAKVEDRSKDEFGQLSRGLNEMAAELESLIQARGELATMEARNRFARDLHDSVKQQVYATSLQVDTARALMEPGEKADGHLVKARNLLQGAQKELNVLIHEMRPAALEGKGLAGALRDYAKDWSRGSEVPVEVRVRGEREVPLEAEQALFRVAQEALANVARHSKAKNVEIDLDYGADGLTLRVADDGRGFDPQAPKKGFGLKSMRERLSRLGGHVEIRSAPREGTRILCVCPTGCPDGNGAGAA